MNTDTPTSPAEAESPASSTSVAHLHRNWVWRMIQIFMQTLLVPLMRYRAEGLERYPADTGALLLINHQSYLDPMLVGLPLRRPVSFLARDSLFRVPVIGWILKKTYVMPINRERAGTASIRTAISRMQEGYLVGVFPEGTRTESGEIGDLKPGFIALIRRVDQPIIPVGISGAYRAMPRGSLLIRPARVAVYVGEPLDPACVAELRQRGRESEFVEYVHKQLELAHQAAQDMLS